MIGDMHSDFETFQLKNRRLLDNFKQELIEIRVHEKEIDKIHPTQPSTHCEDIFDDSKQKKSITTHKDDSLYEIAKENEFS